VRGSYTGDGGGGGEAGSVRTVACSGGSVVTVSGGGLVSIVTATSRVEFRVQGDFSSAVIDVVGGGGRSAVGRRGGREAVAAAGSRRVRR
jgi:hypothetical protein